MVLYADQDDTAGADGQALGETERRRDKQLAYTSGHGHHPRPSASRSPTTDRVDEKGYHAQVGPGQDAEDTVGVGHNLKELIADLENRMKEAAATWKSRRPPGCATRSRSWRRPTWACPPRAASRAAPASSPKKVASDAASRSKSSAAQGTGKAAAKQRRKPTGKRAKRILAAGASPARPGLRSPSPAACSVQSAAAVPLSA
ncbi:MAG: hypothetical protein U5L08_06400 [Xanthomonadales bacterium]|nr:hypothetical protein [Xanthomonadales bacterium]